MVKTCKWCGSEFTAYGSSVYCCSECRRQAKNQYQREQSKKKRKPGHRKCKNCGKIFEVDRHHSFYCSKECMEASAQEARRQYYQDHKAKERARIKEWEKQNPDKYKKWRREHDRDKTCLSPDYVPYRCRKRGQTSCFTCSLEVEDCHG